jgi:tetratricopeptide (TPR) repeat protein
MWLNPKAAVGTSSVPGMLMAVSMCALFVAPAGRIDACFYTRYWFDRTDNSQTSVRKLVYGEYIEADRARRTSFYTDELRQLEAELSRKQKSPEFLEDYAYVLFRVGRAQSAELIWRQLLQAEPDRHSALCSMATACQLLGRYDEATTMLKRAASLRPKFRHCAEEYHLKMLEFQIMLKREPGRAQGRLFIDELTPLWLSSRLPPGNLAIVAFPDINPDGVAELVRQFPTFGEGWLTLAILLEHEKEYSRAKIAYQKALKTGTVQSASLKQYLDEFVTFEKTNSRIGLAGREVKKLILLLCALAVAYWFRTPLRKLSATIAAFRAKKKDQGKELGR